MGTGRLRPGELLAAAGGAGLLVAMVLDWYGVRSVDPATRSGTLVTTGANAWQALDVLDVFLALTALGGIAVLVLNVVRRSPAVPVAAEVVVTTLAALVLLCVLYRLLNEPGGDDVVRVEPGAYLGALATFAVSAGAFVALRDESGRGAPDPVVERRPSPPPEAAAGASAAAVAAAEAPDRTAAPAALEPEATPREDPIAAPASADPSASRGEGS